MTNLTELFHVDKLVENKPSAEMFISFFLSSSAPCTVIYFVVIVSVVMVRNKTVVARVKTGFDEAAENG